MRQTLLLFVLALFLTGCANKIKSASGTALIDSIFTLPAMTTFPLSSSSAEAFARLRFMLPNPSKRWLAGS